MVAYVNNVFYRHKELPDFKKFINKIFGEKVAAVGYKSIISALKSMPKYKDADE